ncbi:MAG: hypothetical protein KF757_05010 [Phycisphaeraceae bacterium]|nr:hypothetical protein [Phycisphaeraceae bacterium]MCW5763873.1 hypothetical protein [Phycisphaeraceae bacterium]
MSMLITSSLILGTWASPVTEEQFAAQLSVEMSALAAPIVMLDDVKAKGRVSAFDIEKRTVSIRDELGVSRSMTWDDATTWALDGKRSTPKDVLVNDRQVEIKYNGEGVAIHIEAASE